MQQRSPAGHCAWLKRSLIGLILLTHEPGQEQGCRERPRRQPGGVEHFHQATHSRRKCQSHINHRMKQKPETVEMAPLSSYASRFKEVWDVSCIMMKAQMLLCCPFPIFNALFYSAQKDTKYPSKPDQTEEINVIQIWLWMQTVQRSEISAHLLQSTHICPWMQASWRARGF